MCMDSGHVQDPRITRIGSIFDLPAKKNKGNTGRWKLLFGAVSDSLYGCQDHHEQIRDKLVEFVSKNKEVFDKFCPSTATSLDEHLSQMQHKSVWATHLEVFAVASLIQIPVYVRTQRSKSLTCYWELYTPQSCASGKHLISTTRINSCRTCTCTKMSLRNSEDDGWQPTPMHPPEFPKHNSCYLDLT